MSVTAQDVQLGPVGTLNTRSLDTAKPGGDGGAPVLPPQPKPPEPTAREITWTLKPSWTVGEEITADALTLGVTAGENNAILVAPIPGKLAKGGTVTVSAEAPAKGGFARAVKSQDVTVEKLATAITWRDPLPVAVGTVLGDTQLDAEIKPAGPTIAYAPAKNTVLAAPGPKPLKASFAGDDAHLAAKSVEVTLQVFTAVDLPAKLGAARMVQGRAFKPLDPAAKGALDAYNAGDPADPTTPRGRATKIMGDVAGKTGPELIAYMDTLVDVATNPGDKWINDKTKSGLDKEYPNHIWKLPGGMKVRYKPKGDGRGPPDTPTFGIEGMRTDCADFKADQTTVAFKVMTDGRAAPKGPGDTVQDYDEDIDEVSATNYNDAACALTHLTCKPLADQVVTWAGPGVIVAGTALTDKHLDATAKDGVVPRYEDDAEQPVTVGQVLAGGDHEVTAIAAESLRYKEGRKTVTITVQRKPQVLSWKGPVKLTPDAEISADDVGKLGDPVISFTLDGRDVEPDEALPRGTDLDLAIHADETDEYEEADITMKVTVEKREWAITWADPPDIAEGKPLTAAHLNADVPSYTGALAYEDMNATKLVVGKSALAIQDFGDDEDTSEGQEQELTVTALASEVYARTTKTVTIKVLPGARAEPEPKGKASKATGKPQGKGKGRGGRKK
jgi:hypothetical protein